ncbi:vacuolar membrane-associated protein [Achlya hypogyna]|uniref:Vacuolar membrane-associated protein n=1 Tax=Achlya hypogyna TaxID=1202772 RepID=A0A1V9YPM1_ACHHY|nr:vacuolar membrane-associated protein [Achlya hypogyna]
MRRRRSTKAPPATAEPAPSPLETKPKKTKDTATFKLHVHGLEFHGGEELVLNLDALKADLTFPEDDNYIMEIFPTSNTDEPRRHLLMDVPSAEELKAKKPVKGKMSLSVLKDTASLFGLPALQDVVVRFVEKTRAEVDFVEISMKDQFLSRRDLWYLKQALVGKAVYVGKMVRMHGARLQITEMVFENENVTSGVLTDKTCFVYRSKSSRVFWLVQVSPEMWDMANDGDLYAEELLRIASVLFAKWQALHVSHSLTIILFARTLYDSEPAEAAAVQGDGMWYQDYYKVISYGKNGAVDAASLLADMKRELNVLPHLCGWRVENGRLVAGSGRPAPAKDGNVLEALNLILNIYEKHYMDRDLNRSGQNIALFTAGNGIFRVNPELAETTEQRMMDNGIGFDVISLSTPPMEPVPRFLFKHSPSSKGVFDGVVPAWISICFSRYEEQLAAGFEPLPHCRLFALDALCPTPLAFLLRHFRYDAASDGLVDAVVPSDALLTRQPSPVVTTADFAIARTRSHFMHALDDYDDDVFAPRGVDKSPVLLCATPPLHGSAFFANPKRLPRSKPTLGGSLTTNYGLSPELKGQVALRSPMHFQLPARYPSPQPGGSPQSPPRGLVPRKMTSPQFMTSTGKKELEKPPVSALSLNSNRRRWSQVYRYDVQQQSFTLDWKSLCVPALLPLTSDFMPKPKELADHYSQAPYALTLSLTNDTLEDGVMYTNHRELVWEMVAQRFSQDFQLVEEKRTHDNTIVYKLSMGHRIHEITYNGDSQQIDVKRYQLRTQTGDKAGDDAKRTNRSSYVYAMWSPLTQSFLPTKQEFRKYPALEYSWNYLDQLICGYYYNMTEQVKYKRGHYCVLPPALAHVSDADKPEVLREFADKFNRFLDYIRLKARGKADTDEPHAGLHVLINFFPEKKQESSKSSGTPETPETPEAPQTPATTQMPQTPPKSQKSQKPQGSQASPSIRHVGQEVAKIPLLAPDAPHSQQWVNIRYDTELLSTQCFHMEVQWLVCRSALVDDFITGLQRRAKQVNLDIVPVPENYGSSTLDIHPLICPVVFPVTKPDILPALEKALTHDLEFCADGVYSIPKELLQSQYMASTTPSTSESDASQKPDRTYHQFMHRELACFVRVTDTSVVWISSRRLHSPEMKALFHTVQALVAKLHETTPEPPPVAKPLKRSVSLPAVSKVELAVGSAAARAV